MFFFSQIVTEFFKAADTNHDKLLTMAECVADGRIIGSDKKTIGKGFERVDTDKNGKLSLAEVKHYVQRIRDKYYSQGNNGGGHGKPPTKKPAEAEYEQPAEPPAEENPPPSEDGAAPSGDDGGAAPADDGGAAPVDDGGAPPTEAGPGGD